ncbi:MAG: dihydroorotase [Oscillospiraceae bacterium]|nr:dihydroorotase [Oscillospiraceae bacterium]MDY2510934.1 dihydroorotase [Ruminococcus callidus]
MQTILLQNVTDAYGVCSDFLVADGKITKRVAAGTLQDAADLVIPADGLTILPGLFDMHVHLRDPGFTQKEDIITGAAAALAGGITDVACMPNTKPTIDTPETVQYILEKAAQTGVQVHPVGCITNGMKGTSLCDYPALIEAGICAISDDGRPVENAEQMRLALEQAKNLNLPVISHCEDLSIIHGGIINKGSISEQLQVKGMDRASEDYITAREIILAASVNGSIHIAHVSTKGSVEIIRQAKKAGIAVTCETCPHYFLMTEEKVLSKDADYRMNPPLRTEEDRQAVLAGILDGTIDCIVTDHAPHTPSEKSDFYHAPNGVIGMETSLAATLTLYHQHLLTLPEIVKLMAERPREILHLPKQTLEVGAPANLTLVDLQKEWVVDPEKLHSKARNAIFKQMQFRGKVVLTMTNGMVRYQDEA